ncbi:RND efflux system, outer membrane lipoprotein, NodT family [Denitrovibrio acetiphilus DSM 12809]|jgi:multidrug efflux system outer membrane protein|uniref:RND efflux system, outer membrane lipoprotein, NodT family n=1 Tax=Denitrovibrio acetiphilus (strain DSM 12809 / NBRC 114555 / N2460) TaxID=522772 RepID=D4H2H4_DENA2|nr:efflux transporter outer membrane subunit [Denitrovibrio acetiphilus]ADD67035.1 RND efflux system, outer membrane lipoprotein, NodT family [Denitrovibrio acetiphilus DSM 12809]
MINKLITAALLCIAVASCSMMPEYNRPDVQLNKSWSKDGKYALNSEEENPASIGWEDYFESSVLKRIISRTLKNNFDMRLAVLNIDAAKAAYRIQKSELLPTVSAKGAASRESVPADLSSTGNSVTSSTFSANLGVTAYELDFFGRVRSLNQKALEAYFATQEAKTSTQIALIAETASAYLEYMADKEMLKLSKKNYDSYKETYELVKRTFELGDATQLEVAQAESAYQSAKSNVAQYTREVAQDINAMNLLAGGNVEDLLDDSESIESLRFLGNLPEGVPSTVLLNRPDIQSAEHSLKAANADIGAARAALYPTISLTGAFGVASNELDNILDSGARYAWNFTPSVSIPIFNRGALKASLETAKVKEKIAATEYEKALQTAFREVADQLAARSTYKEQLDAQEALLKSTKKAYDLSLKRYENGVNSYLTVLDSQRSLVSAQQTVVATRQAYMTNLVTLYKVLGGGQI